MTIHLLEHFEEPEPPDQFSFLLAASNLKAQAHANQIQSLGSLGSEQPALMSMSIFRGKKEGTAVKSVWKWAKILRIRESRLLTDEQVRKADGQLGSLVQAIRGLRFVEHVE